jgi:hypothetical protein
VEGDLVDGDAVEARLGLGDALEDREGEIARLAARAGADEGGDVAVVAVGV